MEKLFIEYSINELEKTNCFQSEIFFEILKIIENIINRNYLDINEQKYYLKQCFSKLEKENLSEIIIQKRMIFNYFEKIILNNYEEKRIYILLLKLYLSNDDLEKELLSLLSYFLKCINLTRKDIHNIYGLFSKYQRESKLNGKSFDKFINYLSVIYNYKEYNQNYPIINYFSIIPGNGFLMKIPHHIDQKYLTIIFSFKPLHFNQISTIFTAKKENEVELFLITLNQKKLKFSLKDKEKKDIGEINEGWNNLYIYIEIKKGLIYINLNNTHKSENKFPEKNIISEIHLFGNFTGEVTSIYGTFKKGVMGIKIDENIISISKEPENKDLNSYDYNEQSIEYKQGFYYIEQKKEKLNLLPYTFSFKDKKENLENNQINEKKKIYEDNQLKFLLSPYLYINTLDNQNILNDYYSFFTCKISKIIFHNYEEYNGNMISLGNISVLYPIFIILNNEEIRTPERVNKLLLIFINLLNNKNNLKECHNINFWDLICQILEKWPIDFFNDELLDTIYTIYDIVNQKEEMNLFSFYLPRYRKKILYMLNYKIIDYINAQDNNDNLEEIKKILLMIIKLMNIEIPNFQNNENLIEQIYILYNKFFEKKEKEKYFDDIILQFLHSYLLLESKIQNNKEKVNIKEQYFPKLVKELWKMFETKDFQNYNFDEEKDTEKILCIYIPILFMLHFHFKNKTEILNQIRERIISLFYKSIKTFFYQNKLVFSLMKADFQINENNLISISENSINNLCVKFPFQEIKLFDYLFKIIENDNEFNKEKDDPIETCQGDYFLYLIIISISSLDKRNPFFVLYSKVSFEFVKTLYHFLDEIKGKNPKEAGILPYHKVFIKYYLFLADSIVKLKREKIYVENLFGGIFKDSSFDWLSVDLKSLECNNYNHYFISGEIFFLNNIKTKNYKRKLIKQLFSYNGYWSDKKVFFPNDEEYENEENKSMNCQLKFKVMNFITNDLKKPLLTPILDLQDYMENFPKNIEEINYDFYKKFSWFNKSINKEKTSFQKNIEDILNVLYEDKTKKLYLYFFSQTYDSFVYKAKLIKLGYEIETLFYFFQDKTNQKIKICFYTIIEEQIQNQMKFKYEIIPCLNKAKDKIIEFKIEDIIMFFPRNYNYCLAGLEFFLINGKNYYFVFQSDDFIKIMKILTNKIVKESSNNIRFIKVEKNELKVIGYFSNKYSIQNNLNDIVKTKDKEKIILVKIIEKWKENKISNYLMLMYLNIFSNRSYSDLSQYPVFPWILYQKHYIEKKQKNIEKDNNNNSNIDESKDNYEEILSRDLSKPMGQLLNNDRNQTFTNNYKNKIYCQTLKFQKESKQNLEKELNKIPVYSTNYSNIFYVTSFLRRIFPFNLIFNVIKQKKHFFENFSSVPLSFYYASSKNELDIRELIPEFYYFHEIFQNINKLKGIENVELEEKIIENSNQSNPFFYYCKTLKEYLEGEEISKHLNSWIDLIFGFCQKEENARHSFNVFRYESYIDSNENNLLFVENKENIENIYIKGLVPIQILSTKCLQKKYSEIKYSVFHAIIRDSLFKINMNKIKSVIFSNYSFHIENFGTSAYIFYNSYIFFIFKSALLGEDEMYSNYLEFKGGKILKDFSEDYKKRDFYANHAIYLDIKDNIYYSFDVGFFNGEIQCFSFKDNKINPIKVNIGKSGNNDSNILPYITAIEIINIEQILITGDTKGDIKIYHIKKNPNEITLQYIKTLYNHTEEIIFINYNIDLNLLICVSKDGLINLYKINEFEFIRSYKSPYKDIKFAYLISNFIPCIIVYASQYLFTFLLNGFNINEKIKCLKISNPHIIKSSNHEDLLMVSKENTIIFFNPCDLKNQNKIITFPYNILSYCFTKELDTIYGYCQNPNTKDYYICTMKGKRKIQ